MTSNRTKFFALLDAITHIENQHRDLLPDLDARALLMCVAVANDKKQPLNVTQAMSLKNIGSPAMLHRKINDLLNHGLIELVFEGTNRRTKYLLPTAKALAMFDAMANASASVYKVANA
jgi:hypothetical protein